MQFDLFLLRYIVVSHTEWINGCDIRLVKFIFVLYCKRYTFGIYGLICDLENAKFTVDFANE